MVHEVLLRRRAMIDQFMEGLEEADFLQLLKNFPEKMLSLLVPVHQPLVSESLIEIMEPEKDPNEGERRTFSFRMDYIRNLKEQGV